MLDALTAILLLSPHIPFLFMASRAEIEEKLRPLTDGVEDFIAKPFVLKDLVRAAKKVVDRIHLEKLQKSASRPGVDISDGDRDRTRGRATYFAGDC